MKSENQNTENGTSSGELSPIGGVCNSAGSVPSVINSKIITGKRILSNEVIIGIYKITAPDGKVYVGKSKDIYKRWEYAYMFVQCSGQPLIYDSLKTYGVNAHTFEIVRRCSLRWLGVWELYFQIIYKAVGYENGLNVIPGSKTDQTKSKLLSLNIKKQIEKKAFYRECEDVFLLDAVSLRLARLYAKANPSECLDCGKEIKNTITDSGRCSFNRRCKRCKKAREKKNYELNLLKERKKSKKRKKNKKCINCNIGRMNHCRTYCKKCKEQKIITQKIKNEEANRNRQCCDCNEPLDFKNKSHRCNECKIVRRELVLINLYNKHLPKWKAKKEYKKNECLDCKKNISIKIKRCEECGKKRKEFVKQYIDNVVKNKKS